VSTRGITAARSDGADTVKCPLVQQGPAPGPSGCAADGPWERLACLPLLTASMRAFRGRVKAALRAEPDHGQRHAIVLLGRRQPGSNPGGD
jgi:hypothetical protein